MERPLVQVIVTWKSWDKLMHACLPFLAKGESLPATPSIGRSQACKAIYHKVGALPTLPAKEKCTTGRCVLELSQPSKQGAFLLQRHTLSKLCSLQIVSIKPDMSKCTHTLKDFQIFQSNHRNWHLRHKLMSCWWHVDLANSTALSQNSCMHLCICSAEVETSQQ